MKVIYKTRIMARDTELLYNEFSDELKQILHYWETFTVDKVNGGFYGAVNNDNRPNPEAPKGAVLCARILWSFSAGQAFEPAAHHLEMADRAYEYLRKYFRDPINDGVYWSLSYSGEPLDTKKQIYAQAFAIYALSEYYHVTGNEEAKDWAISIYQLVEQYSLDKKLNGYIEAFNKDWTIADDLRLSSMEFNSPKTMNTHLHLLEAYSRLYQVWPQEKLKASLKNMLGLFRDHIILPQTHHLGLFFSNEWTLQSHIVSYGHDIEASWLLYEAAELLHDEKLLAEWKKISIAIAKASLEGIDKDGGLMYELNLDTKHLVDEKHWWPQAEAIVGFYNAYQLTKSYNYYTTSSHSWAFIKQYIIDERNGEWYWGVKKDHSIMEGMDKAGFWKCPYHNGRACLEMMKRLPKI